MITLETDLLLLVLSLNLLSKKFRIVISVKSELQVVIVHL